MPSITDTALIDAPFKNADGVADSYYQLQRPATERTIVWKDIGVDASSSLQTFLTTSAPSTVKASVDSIWAISPARPLPVMDEVSKKVLFQARRAYEDLIWQCAEIDKNPNVPEGWRRCKRKGKAKEELKWELEKAFKNMLPQLIEKGGGALHAGKWVMDVPASSTDGAFASLAHHLLNGSLRECMANVQGIEVDCTKGSMVLLLHCGDVWSEAAGRELGEILCRQHGFTASDCISNAYGAVGISPTGLAESCYVLQTMSMLIPDNEDEMIEDYHRAKQKIRAAHGIENLSSSGADASNVNASNGNTSETDDDEEMLVAHPPPRDTLSTSPGGLTGANNRHFSPQIPTKRKIGNNFPDMVRRARSDDSGFEGDDDED